MNIERMARAALHRELLGEIEGHNMAIPHETFVRRIEPASVLPPGFRFPDEGFDPWQLYMVMGLARGAVVYAGGQMLVGEFECLVLGQPGRVRSRECWLPQGKTSTVLIEHASREHYDIGLVFMSMHRFPLQVDLREPDIIYPVIRLLQTTDSP